MCIEAKERMIGPVFFHAARAYAVIGLAIGQAFAAGAAIEEIVVTAERRAAGLQDVPLSVSAFSKSVLALQQVDTLGDLQSLAPNLSIHVGDANNAVVYIRGVGQIDSIAFFEPGVGVYLDDVYLGRAQGAFLDVVDVERIEVLRGPQGTLYGRNSVGGAIKYVSAAPTEEFSGNAQVTVGQYNQLDAKLSVSGALMDDRLLGRLTLAQLGREGYSRNAFDGRDDGDRDTQFLRGVLAFHPSERVDVQLAFDYTDGNPDRSRTPAKETPIGVTLIDPYTSAIAVRSFPADSDPFRVNADFNTTARTEILGYNLNIGWQISDAWNFRSISSYRKLDYGTELDLDGTPINSFGIFYFNDQEQTTQEFQLSYQSARLTALGGLYYFKEQGDTFDGAILSNLLVAAVGEAYASTDSYALFTQFDYSVSDRLLATLGFRYTEEEKDYRRQAEDISLTALAGRSVNPVTSVVSYANPERLNPRSSDLRLGGVGAPRPLADPVPASFDNFSPKIGLKYQLTEDAQVYGNVSLGFKSGGFNGRLADAQLEPYDEETLTSYELGYKSEWLDNRLRVNTAVFFNDYRDLQVSSFQSTPDGSALIGVFTNAGKASMQGLELELTALITDAFSITANLGYLDAEYDEFITASGGKLVDVSSEREMINAPRWDLFFGVNYLIPIARGALTFSADASYRDKTYLEIDSSEILAQGAYSLINAALMYETEDGKWQFMLGGKNLSDERYRTHAFNLSAFPGVELGYYNPPRTLSLSASFSF